MRLQGLAVYYYRPELPRPLFKDRSYFGLSDEDHIYACPQSLFKFHPEFDEFLGEILRRDPRGQLVLIRGRPHWYELLKQRFATTMPDVVDRIRVVPPRRREEFINLMAVADVLLDPIHFGGGNTSYEGFAVGVPIVTLPSPFLRGRITHALYQKMGLTDCVASSRQSYVDLALELGTNPSYRESMRKKILAANDALYEDPTGVRELEDFFCAAVKAAGA